VPHKFQQNKCPNKRNHFDTGAVDIESLRFGYGRISDIKRELTAGLKYNN
jgi:hypothetical protein